jgi:DNA-binding CsgD family transcriptional regulator
MNPIAEEMLMHYGVARRSGRYPWGSGEDPFQHGRDFLGRIDELKKSGWTETPENIMKEFGLTTTQYRTEKSLAKDERRMLEVARVKSLAADGLGPTEIGKIIGKNESTVRSLLNEKSEAKMNEAKKTADFLRARIEEKGMIDVGTGVELELGVSKEKLNQALYILEREGYPVYKGGIPQATNPGQQTNQRVICPPGTEHKEIYQFDKVHSATEYTSHDGGQTFDKFVYPKSMDSKRLQIRYADDVGPDGARGIEKDGIVEIRRGVEDLSLGNSHYAQVRILVDNNKYIKGMAVYSDDMPDGVDVVFNTNKKSDVPMGKVLKDIKKDPDNPFGSLIGPKGQSYYIDKNGERQLSLINKRADEGDWDDWANAIPSQFLGKQSLHLAKKQLDLAKADKRAEYDEICSLTNPTIKKHLLNKFADECDSAAVHLKAAALPGQKYHVIIPINSLKDGEVYAPNYENGTQLALIRYPHGGTFEIPILTVNNKHAPAKKLLGTDVIDAVGITSKVAERLSGADFDGDTVMCIPTNDKFGKVKITSTRPLDGLKDFDPKTQYPERPGMKYMKDPKTGKDSTQMQMGMISNLITDMTLAGASTDELARAVRHSMVVIDAGKHKLDYKQSEIDNGITALKKKYQVKYDADGNEIGYGGASTILSRAKGEYTVPKRQGTPKVNLRDKEWYDPSKPEGSLIYKTADDLEYTVTKTNKRTGEVTTTTKQRTQKSTRMAETDDAMTLVSGGKHPMELLYADYANNMKSLANQARVESATTGKIKYSATAKSTYADEVKSLNVKLDTALLNAGRERAANRMANAEVQNKIANDPTMSKGDIKKARQQSLSKYRAEVGSVSRRDRSIQITDREWDAIQAGAISENTLTKILANADVDKLRERAMPRATTTLSTAKVNRIKAMSNSNYSLTEIAKALGVSTSTVSNYLKGAN